jgi:hypothetical protein
MQTDGGFPIPDCGRRSETSSSSPYSSALSLSFYGGSFQTGSAPAVIDDVETMVQVADGAGVVAAEEEVVMMILEDHHHLTIITLDLNLSHQVMVHGGQDSGREHYPALWPDIKWEGGGKIGTTSGRIHPSGVVMTLAKVVQGSHHAFLRAAPVQGSVLQEGGNNTKLSLCWPATGPVIIMECLHEGNSTTA